MKTFLALAFTILAFSPLQSQTPTELIVRVNEPIADIQPTMWGIFFEDINFAADGGIYAELVKNRSFEFDEPLMGWLQPNTDRHSMNDKSGMATVIKESNSSSNNFVRVEVKNDAGYELINEGFRGMGIKSNAEYLLSLNVRNNSGDVSKIKIQLIDADGKGIGDTEIAMQKGDWKTYGAILKATKTEKNGNLKITFTGNGVVEMDMISLFPKDTWMGRPKGMRKDLVQLLADLKPGFVRFPGGCIVEGRTLDQRYQWKKTVGDINDRKLIINRWNTEFKHRPAPDYFQSFGLGFYEYFQIAEDIGAEPLPILGCGMACQFNTGELVPLEDLDPYVQDALDLIEFANGAVDSEWGKVRASMGHPEPFGLKFIGIGNEQWGADYFDRLKFFINAIKSKYPNIIVVSSAGPFPDGEHFDFANEKLKELHAEIVDEHYYRAPQWFLDNANRYDSYDRNSYKIFAGEYAAQSVATGSPDNKNNWQCALAEAAFLTGLERNADVVHLTSYAPLFAHVDGWQWTPDLIWFDNLTSYGTPNYYVQKMFANNKGTRLLSILSQGQPLTGQNDLFASSVIDEGSKEIIVKIVNAGSTEQPVNIQLEGVKRIGKSGTRIQLISDDLNGVNSIDEPLRIAPSEEQFTVKGKNISMRLAANSFSVFKLPLQ
jgi:alpha-L-arabinofuranosidase